ncbi:hypothetical protein J4422_01265 [Candidatus Pacearchaeota archaeon]|nr:hypothetical protein [Candidatus Pacearchaeota archaeon]
MNKIDTILREAKGKILTRKDFDGLANKYDFDKDTLRKVMLNKGYLVTIFRGVYYLKSHEEKKFNSLKYSPYELLSLGLEKKNVKWYFGLNTALKFLGLTHEVFPVNIVINNKFNRTAPLKIAGSSFLFVKLKPSLFFEIKETKTNNNIPLYFSNLEKTLLDLIYLKKIIDLNEYKFNKSLFLRESVEYNRIVKKRIKEML